MIYINKDHPVAITGALGRIGHRVATLLKDEFPLKLLDLRAGELAGLPVEAANIVDLDQVLKACKGCSAIVHFAIADYSNHSDNSAEPIKAEYRQRMLDVNIRGAYNIFEAARILGIPKIIFISSLTVALGDTSPNASLSPKLAPNPVNFYACTKIFGEYTAQVFYKEYGIKTYSLRVGQPYPFGTPCPEDFPEREREWLKQPNTVAHMVTMPDITRAVSAGLKADSPGFGSYNVVSKCHWSPINISDGEEIGFIPQDEIAKITGMLDYMPKASPT